MLDSLSRLVISENDNNQIEYLNLIESFNLYTAVTYKNISAVHNSYARHHGVEKTLYKLQEVQKLSWPTCENMLKNS